MEQNCFFTLFHLGSFSREGKIYFQEKLKSVSNYIQNQLPRSDFKTQRVPIVMVLAPDFSDSCRSISPSMEQTLLPEKAQKSEANITRNVANPGNNDFDDESKHLWSNGIKIWIFKRESRSRYLTEQLIYYLATDISYQSVWVSVLAPLPNLASC